MLSTLSPCVVPILPILVASAVARHRLGLWALAAGLACSFAAVGLFVATVGMGLGIDGAFVHRGAGLLLIAFGAVMASPRLQRVFASSTTGVAARADRLLSTVSGRSVSGQFAVGLLLGVVWTPCVGPTLGAASTLAAQGRDLGAVAMLMTVFGLGAATPLVVFGTVAHRMSRGARPGWLGRAETMRRGLGLLLVAAGVLVVGGLDKALEAWLLERSPDWLTTLTTRF